MKRLWLALAAGSLAASAAAQAPDIQDADALKAQRDLYRQVWKKQPDRPASVTIPLYGRIMRIDMPVGFLPAYKVQSGGEFLFEFTQGEETVESWKRLVTIRSMAGAGASTFDSEYLADSIFRPRGCRVEPIYRILEKKDLGGGLSSLSLVTACGGAAGGLGAEKAGPVGEIDFIRMLRDGENLYSYAMAVRTRRFTAASPPISDAQGLALLAAFGDVLLCRPGAQEGPCRDVALLERMRSGR
ncbi:MAG: hypothetical protein ACJ8ER_05035 [Allosphingosinicella sp.]